MINVNNNRNLVNNNRAKTAGTTNKKQSFREKFRIPNEIERWAIGQNNDLPAYDLDEFESIDDKYLEEIATFDTNIESTDKNSQNQRIHQMLENLRKKKQAKLAKKYKNKIMHFQSSDQFKSSSNLSNVTSTSTGSQPNSSLPNVDGMDLQKNSSFATLTPPSTMSSTNTKKESEKENNKSKVNTNFNFKNVNNEMLRAVPGSLQQNITLERNLFRDLMRLSRQRYLFRIGSDFQRNQFSANQTRKGFLSDKNNQAAQNKFRLSNNSSKLSDESDRSVADSYTRIRKQKSLSAAVSRKLKIDENGEEGKEELDAQEKERKPPAVSSMRTKSAKISFNPKVEINESNLVSNQTQTNEIVTEKTKVINNEDPTKSIKSNLKRPKTSLPVLNSTNSQTENQKKQVDNEEASKFQPRGDQRYINLYESINEVYITHGSVNGYVDPTERLNNILCSRLALQGNRGAHGVTFEKDSSTLMKIENNKKLFRKTVLNLF